MSDDIVARLRAWARGADDQGVEDVAVGLNSAADEIERLRVELVRNADEFRETLTELHQRVETLTSERDEANANAKLYRDDRDEARAEVCLLRPSVCLGAQTADEYAKHRGWDCFKEPAHAP